MFPKLKQSRYRVSVPETELNLFHRMLLQQRDSEVEFLRASERELVDPAEVSQAQASLAMCVRILAEDLPLPTTGVEAPHGDSPFVDDEAMADFLRAVPFHMLSGSERRALMRAEGQIPVMAITGAGSVAALVFGGVKLTRGRSGGAWLGIGLGGLITGALDGMLLFPRLDPVTLGIYRRIARAAEKLAPRVREARPSTTTTEPPG
jgi:hypothetical protein